MKKKLTLADFSVPIPLTCHHCDRHLSKKSVVELQPPYVLIQCAVCGLTTPFKLETAV